MFLVYYIYRVFFFEYSSGKYGVALYLESLLFSGLNSNLYSSQFHWTSLIQVTSWNAVFVFWRCNGIIKTISLIYQIATGVLQFVVENSRGGALDFLLRVDILRRTRCPRGLRPHAHWDCGFESRRGHGCMSLICVACCQVEVSASGWPLVQRIPTEFEVSKWMWSWSLANEKA